MSNCRVARIARFYLLCSTLMGCGVLGLPRIAKAQDPFEIRIEQYEEPSFGAFTFEQHVNYVQAG